VEPDRVMKEVVEGCQTFMEDDALQRSPLSKKRKGIAEGLQNKLEPSRSPKDSKRSPRVPRRVPSDKALPNCPVMRVRVMFMGDNIMGLIDVWFDV